MIDAAALARAAFPKLAEAWRDRDGAFPVDARGREAARIALLAPADAVEIEASALAALIWLRDQDETWASALALIEQVEPALPAEHRWSSIFLRLCLETVERAGDRNLLTRLLYRRDRHQAPADAESAIEDAALALQCAGIYVKLGSPAEALPLAQAARREASQAGDDRLAAIAMSQIADILRRQGEVEEALRIHREEELPVYERIGDARSYAVTMGQIADILQRQGNVDEALRIYREEQLLVFRQMGDARSYAVTMGKIADVLRRQGEVDEALRIHREEQLSVFQRIGDARSCAITMSQIADILQQQGEVDEALRIYREEELPVYERIGDARSYAITMGQIADILRRQGDVDEALRIRREEQLPVFQRIGDAREHAITMGKIADILQQQGDVDESLRIRREEELPVYERIGDVREQSTTLHRIGLTLLGNGGIKDGRIQEIFESLWESYQIAVTMRLPDGIGHVGLTLAQVMAMGSLRQEALEVLDNAAAAFAKLKDDRGVQAVQEIRAQIESMPAQAGPQN